MNDKDCSGPQTKPVDYASYNRSNPSFFQITNRFDRPYARPERRDLHCHSFAIHQAVRRRAWLRLHRCKCGARSRRWHRPSRAPDPVRLAGQMIRPL
jgi:hypothetical protein